MTDGPTHISEVVRRLDDISGQHAPAAQAHITSAQTETERAQQAFLEVANDDQSPEVLEVLDNYRAAQQKMEEARALLTKSLGNIAVVRNKVTNAGPITSGPPQNTPKSPSATIENSWSAREASHAFVDSIDNAFSNITDDRSRNKPGPEGTESAKLYPWAPLEGHDVTSVVITQDTAAGAGRERIIATPTVVLNEGDFSTLYHIKDGEIWKRHTDSHGKRPGETESAAVRRVAVGLQVDMQLDAALTEAEQAKVNQARTFGAPIDRREAAQLLEWLSSLHDRPEQLYSPVLPVQENAESLWTARFTLPEVRDRTELLQALHEFVQECARTSRLDPDVAAARGLSGVLIGGGDDGERPHTIVLYRDPSRKYGTRSAMDLESQAARLEREFGLVRVEQVFEDDFMRTIMGRNIDHYGGSAAFTLQEVQATLPEDVDISIEGGYHFSTRPGWAKPYGEPAGILTANAGSTDSASKNRVIEAFSKSGWLLNRQKRWTLETLDATIPYNSNE